MKIGIMGGTFDPIHNGHLLLGEFACEENGLDEVWFMPNGNPPHKKKSIIESAAEDRLNMTALAIREYPKFRLNLHEAEDGRISYSYQTLEYLRTKYREDEFYFIIGADSLFSIETWVYPERVLSACTILAAYRDEADSEQIMFAKIHELNEKYHADIRLLRTPLFPVSSSQLRRKIKMGESIAGLVPETVERYIKENGLYKERIK